MRTPTTDQLRTAIEVLKNLGERINEHAAHSVIQLPESCLGDQHSARIQARAIEQTSQIDAVAGQLEAWCDELQHEGGNVSPIISRPGHALPLRAEGFPVREAVAVHPQNKHAI